MGRGARGAGGCARGRGAGGLTVEGAPRTLLVCVDGADWRVLSPQVDAGRMPALAALVERGESGRVASVDGAGGATAWATVLTGASAMRHGVLSGRVVADDGRTLRAVACGDRALPTIWERASAAGHPTAIAGWDEPFAPADGTAWVIERAVPAWAEAIAGPVTAAEPGLAGLLRALAAAFEGELHAAESACSSRPWELACVHVAGWAALVREFVRFAPPAGPGVPAAQAIAFGGVVDAACSALDGWLGRLVGMAGDGAAIVLAGERGLDLERWRTPASPVGPGAMHFAAAAPAAFVAVGPGMRPDSLRHGMVAVDVARITLAFRGIDGFRPPASRGDVPLPPVPEGEVHAEVRALLQERDAAFAHAAAVGGAIDAAVAARSRMAARVPSDAANAAELADLLVARGDAAAALAAVDACRTAWRASGDGPSGEPRAMPWPPWLAEARALLASDRSRDAAASIDRAASAGAPEVEVLLACASVAASAEDYVASERHARAAIVAAPSSREARMALARALFAQERFPDAAGAARDAIGMAWADPFAHLLLGTALAAHGRAREAIAALEDCLRVRPEFPPALRRLAAVHMNQLGDVAAARALMARAAAAARPVPPPRAPLP